MGSRLQFLVAVKWTPDSMLRDICPEPCAVQRGFKGCSAPQPHGARTCNRGRQFVPRVLIALQGRRIYAEARGLTFWRLRHSP